VDSTVPSATGPGILSFPSQQSSCLLYRPELDKRSHDS
jgi:hypothetical protein